MGYRRKTIGVILSILDSFYKSEMWIGLKDQATAQDSNILFFSGMPLMSPFRMEKQENIIYSLINQEKVDALIIETGTISNYLPAVEFNKYVKHFDQVPLVSTSVEVPGKHSIVLDNKESMKRMVVHLIETHGYKKIAFVCGPMTNEEAVHRLEGYKEALAENSIPYEDDYVYYGDFTQRSGNFAIDELYGVRGIRPEVIVFSNDEMAVGGVLQLGTRGISVPDDVKVTGFDDIDAAKGFTVPLTTIRQPFYEMGRQAIEVSHQLADSKPIDRVKTLQGELIIRESCGCNEIIPKLNHIHHMLYALWGNEQKYSMESFSAVFEHHRYQIIEHFIMLVGGQHKREFLVPQFDFLMTALMADLRTSRVEGIFIQEFNKLIKSCILLGEFDLDWNSFLLTFVFMQDQIQMEPALCDFIQKISQMTNIIANNLAIRNELLREFDFKTLYYRISHLIQEMSNVKSRNELIELVHAIVEENRFSRYYICLFDEGVSLESAVDSEYPEKVQLIYGYEEGRLLEPVYFDTKEMLPDYILYHDVRSDLAFFPLHYKNQHFGYVCSDIQSVRNALFKSLRELICNTLDRLVLFNKQIQAEEKLVQVYEKDMITGLMNRQGLIAKGQEFLDDIRLSEEPVTVLFCEIANIEAIKEEYGHFAGDRALEEVSAYFVKMCPDARVIGTLSERYFLILYKGERAMEELISKFRAYFLEYNKHVVLPYPLEVKYGYGYYGNVTIEDIIDETQMKIHEYSV